MPRRVNLYGPPGSGKTTRLTRLFIQAAEQVGPEHVAGLTYTRAAAYELRHRVAAALGIQGTDRELRMRLPWIGTIHSLCYRLIGARPQIMVDGKRARDFCAVVGISGAESVWDGPLGDDFDTVVPIGNDGGGRIKEYAAVQLASSSARHRMRPIEEVIPIVLNAEELARVGGAQRIIRLAQQYEAWKQEEGLLDFEDLLDAGQRVHLPVRWLFVDEAQDNTPLLWEVVKVWEAHATITVSAGDPYQAIYLFAGASPDLFINRPGEWKIIGDCHRFSDADAAYARRVLADVAGAGDGRFSDLFHSWRGVGGDGVDGTEFYLARTWGLVYDHADTLIENGTPYGLLRGRGPLEVKGARAYVAVKRLVEGREATLDDLRSLIDSVEKGWLTRGVKAEIIRLAKADRGDGLSLIEACRVLGVVGANTGEQAGNLGRLADRLANADYYGRVYRKHGPEAFTLKPKLQLGTVHAAKGKEADVVTGCRSWAYKPGSKLSDPRQRLEEACVAYVMATRHRRQFKLHDVGEGIPYPFPPRGGQ